LLTHYTKGTIKQKALSVFSIKIQNLFHGNNTTFHLSLAVLFAIIRPDISLEQGRPFFQLFLVK